VVGGVGVGWVGGVGKGGRGRCEGGGGGGVGGGGGGWGVGGPIGALSQPEFEASKQLRSNSSLSPI